MSTAIKLINKPGKKKEKGILKILKSINENNISDAIGIQALKTYTDISNMSNINISNNVITTEKQN